MLRTMLIVLLTGLCAGLLIWSCSDTAVPVTVTQFTDPSYITGIAKYDGYVYCATRGGLVRWDLDTREYAIITTAEGLVSNVLTDVIVDGDGLLWVSSHEGIASFNGAVWKRYGIAQGLPSAYVNDLSLDNDGRLWVSTRDGAASHSGGRFTLLAEPGSPGRKPVNMVFFDKGGNIWIGLEDGGITFKLEGEWTELNKEPVAVAQSWDLNIWAYSDVEVQYWSGLSFVGYPMIENVKALGAHHIDSGDHYLWFFTDNGVHGNHGSADWVRYTETEGLISNMVTSGLVVSDDELYVGTVTGMSVIRDGVIENYHIPGMPTGYNCISVAPDPQGRMWLGTWESGTNFYADNVWTLLSGTEQVREDLQTVRSFAFGPDDAMVFLTVEGALLYGDGTWQQENRASGLAGNDIRCGLFDAAGILWLGTDGGVSRLDDDGWKRFREYHGLPNDDIWACVEDSDGTVWFGTTGGIASINGDTVTDRSAETGLDSLDVRSACAVNGTVWFGTADGKLVQYDGASWNVYGATALGIDSAIFALAAEPSGAIWLGTDGDGIVRFEDGGTEHYTMRDGLPFDVVRSLAWYDGKLWAACYGGVAVIERHMPEIHADI